MNTFVKTLVAAVVTLSTLCILALFFGTLCGLFIRGCNQAITVAR
jgi:hypothetical protein